MRTLILASLLSGAAAWSGTGLLADPATADDENVTAPAEEATGRPITVIVDWAAGVGAAEPPARSALLSFLAR